MEKIFYLENDNLKEVNAALAKGGTVKMISSGAQSLRNEIDSGSTYAYIVVDMPKS